MRWLHPSREGNMSDRAQVFCVLAGLTSVLFLLPLSLSAEEARPPRFVIRTTTGNTFQGPLRQITEEGTFLLGFDEEKAIPGDQVVAVSQEGRFRPPLPTSEQLILVNGDRLPTPAVRLVGERFCFTHPALNEGKETSVSLGVVALFWRSGPEKAVDPERIRRRLLLRSRPRDLVLLRNGDELQGVLSGLEAREVLVRSGRKTIPIQISQLAAIGLSTELAESLKPPEKFARLVLGSTASSPGARLTVTALRCSDGTHLEATTLFGAPLRVPLKQVMAIDLHHPRCVCLSDRKPASYEYRPFLGETWPWTANANPLGHDLRLAGSTYQRGIGLHGPCQLTYKLDGSYRHFEALVGLDDRDGQRGSVGIRILADGKEVKLEGGPAELTVRHGPRRIRVAVNGVRELTLIVDAGAHGNVQDVVNWVEARLLK
jgi:hypothetical protein